MPPRLVIEITPHRYGWACGEHVFVLKPHAIRFAQRCCQVFPAEIRVCDRNGELEQTLRLELRRNHAAA